MKNAEIEKLISITSRITTIDLEPKTILNIIKLRKKLNSQHESLMETKQELIKQYDIEVSENGSFSWNNHPKKEEITKKFIGLELAEADLEINENEKIGMEDFKKIMKQFSIPELELLNDFLVKN